MKQEARRASFDVHEVEDKNADAFPPRLSRPAVKLLRIG